MIKRILRPTLLLSAMAAIVLAFLLSSNLALFAQTTSDNRLAGIVKAVALTADNQAVSAVGTGFIQLTSDNATATNRTFTLTASPIVGHTVTLESTDGTNLCEIADTGIQKLAGTWTCAQYDTLTLISDGTNWLEVTRADN